MDKSSQKNQEAFDRWLLLEDDNLNLNEVKIRISDLPQKILQAISQLDGYYQLFFLSQAVQMVIGGLKPATSFTIDYKLIKKYQENKLIGEFNLEKFYEVMFDIFGLRICEKYDNATDKSTFLLINPSIFKLIHIKYPQLLKLEDENVYDWINNNIKNGTNEDFVNGIIFGYPISAVKQFIKYQTDEACRYLGRNRISSYGESYFVWGDEIKRDVNIREKVKEIFFTNLASDDLYRKISNNLDSRAGMYRQISRDVFEEMIYSLQVSRDIKNS